MLSASLAQPCEFDLASPLQIICVSLLAERIFTHIALNPRARDTNTRLTRNDCISRHRCSWQAFQHGGYLVKEVTLLHEDTPIIHEQFFQTAGSSLVNGGQTGPSALTQQEVQSSPISSINI